MKRIIKHLLYHPYEEYEGWIISMPSSRLYKNPYLGCDLYVIVSTSIPHYFKSDLYSCRRFIRGLIKQGKTQDLLVKEYYNKYK